MRGHVLSGILNLKMWLLDADPTAARHGHSPLLFIGGLVVIRVSNQDHRLDTDQNLRRTQSP